MNEAYMSLLYVGVMRVCDNGIHILQYKHI